MVIELVGEDVDFVFIVNIYGFLSVVEVFVNVFFLFVVFVVDDFFFVNSKFGLIENWYVVKKLVEFYFYEQGGYGFGMYLKEIISIGWFSVFVSWLIMYGMFDKNRN